jgi:hypothetical protein
MPELNFITIGDKNFFPFINFSIKKIMNFYPSCKFFIYDWGFTQKQKNIINLYPITILIDWNNKLDRNFGYKHIIRSYKGFNPEQDHRKKEYLWNQKPHCLLDCTKRVKENLFYLDGDVILINKIDEILKDNFDIGVTMHPLERIEWLKSIDFLDTINAGVIFFKLPAESMRLFIEEWIKEIKLTKRLMIEQSALTSLITRANGEIFRKYYNKGIIELSNNKKILIKTFPSEIYNFHPVSQGYNDKKVKLIHFCGYGVPNPLYTNRELHIRIINTIKEIKFRDIYSKFLNLLPQFIRTYVKRLFPVKLLLKIFIFHPLSKYWLVWIIKRNYRLLFSRNKDF